MKLHPQLEEKGAGSSNQLPQHTQHARLAGKQEASSRNPNAEELVGVMKQALEALSTDSKVCKQGSNESM